jgi:SPP1 gp7 family putative phage head morphogenesis protein
MAEPPADPDRFHEAVRAFRRRLPLPDPEFRALDEAARQRAFWVAGVTQARVVQEVMDGVERAIRDGTTLEDFRAEFGARLAEAWGGEDAPRLETVFRTNILGAYNAGRTEIFSDPEVRKSRPYLRFDAVGDSRTSEICEALDGTVLPADDPFWKTHTPPLHHQCRSILTPLTAEEAGEEGVADETPEIAPDEGFGRPDDVENWEPDLSGFEPAIRQVLKDQLG